jgi:hypothetical protein
MKKFAELVRYLTDMSGEEIMAAASEVLVREVSWCSLITDYVRGLPDEEFYRLILLGSRVPGVTPKPFLLHKDDAGKFQIVLNHFDRLSFDALFLACRIRAHYHHFSFTTRILNGAYYQWIYKNEGNLAEPRLKLITQTKCEVGDVCTLPYDVFHLVLAPVHDTLSLVIRGPAVFDPGHPQDPSYTKSAICEARTTLLRILRQAPPSSRGRLVSHREIGVTP